MDGLRLLISDEPGGDPALVELHPFMDVGLVVDAVRLLDDDPALGPDPRPRLADRPAHRLVARRSGDREPRQKLGPLRGLAQGPERRDGVLRQLVQGVGKGSGRKACHARPHHTAQDAPGHQDRRRGAVAVGIERSPGELTQGLDADLLERIGELELEGEIVAAGCDHSWGMCPLNEHRPAGGTQGRCHQVGEHRGTAQQPATRRLLERHRPRHGLVLPVPVARPGSPGHVRSLRRKRLALSHAL